MHFLIFGFKIKMQFSKNKNINITQKNKERIKIQFLSIPSLNNSSPIECACCDFIYNKNKKLNNINPKFELNTLSVIKAQNEQSPQWSDYQV